MNAATTHTMTSVAKKRMMSGMSTRRTSFAISGSGSDTTATGAKSTLRVLTYNVHSFVGADHVYDPERTARVIESARPDVVALQEVDFGRGPRAEHSAVERLAARLGMRCHFTYTRDGARGHFGNAVLTPHSLELIAEGTLPRKRDEARAVQWLKIRSEGFVVHLMNTHLSVSFRERHAQTSALLGAEWALRASTNLPLVVCGDFNASPLSPVYRKLRRDLKDAQCGKTRHATWPSRLPLLRIDHIFVSPEIVVREAGVMSDRLARLASDHLPLVAELELPSG
jgi:endonuclease/exonuclease/phosphatase family metal-dependent hydrolase